MSERTTYWREYARRRYESDAEYKARKNAGSVRTQRKRRANRTPEEKRERVYVEKLHRAAREEATERGVPVTDILQEWGASP